MLPRGRLVLAFMAWARRLRGVEPRIVGRAAGVRAALPLLTDATVARRRAPAGLRLLRHHPAPRGEHAIGREHRQPDPDETESDRPVRPEVLAEEQHAQQ